jgi:hypothetical protein
VVGIVGVHVRGAGIVDGGQHDADCIERQKHKLDEESIPRPRNGEHYA